MIEKRTESRQTKLLRRLHNRFASLALLLALVMYIALRARARKRLKGES